MDITSRLLLFLDVLERGLFANARTSAVLQYCAHDKGVRGIPKRVSLLD